MKTDNELIAKFVGNELHSKLCYHEFGAIDYSSCNGFYDTSWDWLIPVVEKIEKIHSSKFHYDPTQIAQGNWPPDNEYMEVIALPLATPITEVYKAVVEFIKWYKQQNENSASETI